MRPAGGQYAPVAVGVYRFVIFEAFFSPGWVVFEYLRLAFDAEPSSSLYHSPLPFPSSLPPQEMLERMQMAKAWSRYSLREHHAFLKRVDDIRQCAIEALDELKALNPALYEAARQPETSDFPLTAKEAMDAPPPSLLGLSQTDGAAHTIESQAGGGATLSLADLRDRAIAAEKKKAAEGSSGGAAGSSSGSSSNSASGR